jgi:hypothetical protein
MPNPLSHHPAMLIIKPDSLPPLWWLNPWSVCRQLHKNANALKSLADRQDDLLRAHAKTIAELRKNSEYDRVFNDVVTTLKKHNL